MRRFLKHVLRRTVFVLIVLGVGLFGWPGDVGAQSLMNFGQIEKNGARRIKVAPRTPPKGSEADAAGHGVVGTLAGEHKPLAVPSFSGRLKSIAGFSAVTLGLGSASDRPAEAQGATTADPADALRAEFSTPAPARSPYEVSHAALAAAR